MAASSEDYIQEMWAGKSSILVALRCRPMASREKRSGQHDLLTVMDGKVPTDRPPAPAPRPRPLTPPPLPRRWWLLRTLARMRTTPCA